MFLSPVRGLLNDEVRITQSFGADFRRNGKWVYKSLGMKGHNGVDFAGEKPGMKVPVYSPYDAIVWKIRISDTGYGNNIVLLTDRGGDGLQREVILAHLDSISLKLKEGDRVYLGDQVGVMGNTGLSTAVHLHVGLRRRNPDMTVKNYNNGYFGYVDFEPYLLFWT